MQHTARSTDEKLNELISIVWFILARSTEHEWNGTRHKWNGTQHGARSTEENFWVGQISNFSLKKIFLIMRTHDQYVEVWIKIDLCCVLRYRALCSVFRAACKYKLALIVSYKKKLLVTFWNYFCNDIKSHDQLIVHSAT